MSDDVILLGTKGGPAIRQGSAMPTASLLRLAGRQIVVDCGLGVTRALVDQGVALKDLSTIVITHLHSDHYLELGPLLHTAWTAGLKTAVDVHGPTGLARSWQGFLAAMAEDIATRIEDEGRPDLAALIRLHPLRAGDSVTLGPVTLDTIASLHPPLKESLSLRFRAAGKTVVFSGDTAPNPALIAFARGADLLIHEAMLEPALGPLLARVGNGDGRLMQHWLRSHSFAHDAARTAAQAGVKALALHHLIPSDDPAFGPADWQAAVAPHFTGPLHIGHDGLKIPL
ncbi:MAG: MBL fold metallo-hydrolase [Rhodobacterales bacterium 17-64-5]|nr:MAG: MBL fold metallo-hydrolase [Rhodobacterales bacterium 17-64-5]